VTIISKYQNRELTSFHKLYDS